LGEQSAIFFDQDEVDDQAVAPTEHRVALEILVTGDEHVSGDRLEAGCRDDELDMGRRIEWRPIPPRGLIEPAPPMLRG